VSSAQELLIRLDIIQESLKNAPGRHDQETHDPTKGAGVSRGVIDESTRTWEDRYPGVRKSTTQANAESIAKAANKDWGVKPGESERFEVVLGDDNKYHVVDSRILLRGERQVAQVVAEVESSAPQIGTEAVVSKPVELSKAPELVVSEASAIDKYSELATNSNKAMQEFDAPIIERLGEENMNGEQWELVGDSYADYIASGYAPINSMLRGDSPKKVQDIINATGGGWMDSLDDVKQANETMLKFAETQNLPKDIVLYRTIAQNEISRRFDAKEDLTGVEITDKGWASTSLLPEHALPGVSESAGIPPTSVLLEIHAPKGLNYIAANPNEFEVTLKPGTKFTVVGQEETEDANSRQVRKLIVEATQ